MNVKKKVLWSDETNIDNIAVCAKTLPWKSNLNKPIAMVKDGGGIIIQQWRLFSSRITDKQRVILKENL